MWSCSRVLRLRPVDPAREDDPRRPPLAHDRRGQGQREHGEGGRALEPGGHDPGALKAAATATPADPPPRAWPGAPGWLSLPSSGGGMGRSAEIAQAIAVWKLDWPNEGEDLVRWLPPESFLPRHPESARLWFMLADEPDFGEGAPGLLQARPAAPTPAPPAGHRAARSDRRTLRALRGGRGGPPPPGAEDAARAGGGVRRARRAGPGAGAGAAGGGVSVCGQRAAAGRARGARRRAPPASPGAGAAAEPDPAGRPRDCQQHRRTQDRPRRGAVARLPPRATRATAPGTAAAFRAGSRGAADPAARRPAE